MKSSSFLGWASYSGSDHVAGLSHLSLRSFMILFKSCLVGQRSQDSVEQLVLVIIDYLLFPSPNKLEGCLLFAIHFKKGNISVLLSHKSRF